MIVKSMLEHKQLSGATLASEQIVLVERAVEYALEGRLTAVLATSVKNPLPGEKLALLSAKVADTDLPRKAKIYCAKRGVAYVGEVYQLSRISTAHQRALNRQALTSFLRRNGLPAQSDPVSLGWRPPYVDDPAIRAFWNEPVGRLLLDHPEGPYQVVVDNRWPRSDIPAQRWRESHINGYHYIGQLLPHCQSKPYGLQYLQQYLRRRRLPYHAAMLVLDWTPPTEVPPEWSEYLKRMGIPSIEVDRMRQISIRPLSAEEQKLNSRKAFLLQATEDLELSVRSSNCLRALEIKAVWDLVTLSPAYLLAAHNFGQKSLRELSSLLEERGLKLGMTEEEVIAILKSS